MIQKLLLAFILAAFTFAAQAQQSKLERRIQGTGGSVTDTLDNGAVVTLDLSTDDVEQENDEVDSRFDDDLDAGWEGEPADQNLLHMGLRFRDLYILQGSTIDSAYIRLWAHEGKTAADIARITIVGEADDNSATFDTVNFNDNFLLTDRPQTSAQVSWTVAEDWTIWQPYKTADLSPIVQEIVNRPGWQSGNAMSFIFLAENQGPSTVENAREFTSFENIADPDDFDPQGNPGDGRNHPEWVPQLVVYVQGPLGITEKVVDLIKVYPNPVTNGELKIELPEMKAAGLKLIDLVGHVVKEQQVAPTKLATLKLNELPAGVYILQVTQGSYTFDRKVVIK